MNVIWSTFKFWFLYAYVLTMKCISQIQGCFNIPHSLGVNRDFDTFACRGRRGGEFDPYTFRVGNLNSSLESMLQGNLNFAKSLDRPNRGFVLLRFFFIDFTITGAKNIATLWHLGSKDKDSKALFCTRSRFWVVIGRFQSILFVSVFQGR